MSLSLICHPDFLSDAITGIYASIEFLPDGRCKLHYRVFGFVDVLELPAPSGPVRTDELWHKTCFEAFIGGQGTPRYLEFNFSPSTQWALYAFEGYREGMSSPDIVSAPQIETAISPGGFELTATVDLSGLQEPDAVILEIALTAVIVEKNGRKSLWALNHPSGNPDFHDRNCFIHKFNTAELR